MKKENKKGQIAIFVILAIVIVGIVLIVFAYPSLKGIIAPETPNPKSYLESCMQPEVKTAVETLSNQGGDSVPVGFITWNGIKIKYLCYITGYYKTCIVQQPMIISHFADELAKILVPKANACVRSMKTDFEKRGYSVALGTISSNVRLASGFVGVEFLAPMTITKDTTKLTFNKLDVGIRSEIYDLLSISTSIVDFESTYGDSEITGYSTYYPDIKIKKVKLEDGIKVYNVTNVITSEQFLFATRSLVWPAGFGL